jgi:hypothetical protein
LQLEKEKKTSKQLTYWEINKHLVYQINCAEILEQEEKDGIPVFKRGSKLIKEITKQKNRGYIPTPYKGKKFPVAKNK